ncbi:MAG: ABC transporter permease [Treponema sp.]|nr:ABC transporter permease [Treponema sp.]
MKNNLVKKALRSNILLSLMLSVILLIVGQIISPGFAEPGNIMNLLMIASFLGIITLAQTIVMITDSGGIDLSVGSILQFSMVVISQINATVKDAFLLSLVISLGACTTFGLLNGIGIAVLKIPPMVMTFSMSSVALGVMLAYTKGFSTGTAPRVLSNFVYGETLSIPNMIFIWIIVTVLAVFIMSKTKIGRIMYGVGSNRLTAELSGANTRKVRVLAYGVSGLVCGVAGVFLLGYMSSPHNLETGARYIMPSIAAAVVGGVSLSGGDGNYGGVALGVVFLTILEAMLMTIQMGEPVRKIIFGIVVIAILINYVRKNAKNR